MHEALADIVVKVGGGCGGGGGVRTGAGSDGGGGGPNCCISNLAFASRSDFFFSASATCTVRLMRLDKSKRRQNRKETLAVKVRTHLGGFLLFPMSHKVDVKSFLYKP